VALVLASRSPQRRAILDQLGVPFTVRVTDIDERGEGEPHAIAGANARAKALAAAARERETVLAVDTLVTLDGELWGKPVGPEAARHTLERLGGRTHEVVSGLALARPDDDLQVATAATAVTFRPLDDALLDWYVATGEWRERAGGYAIQGRGAALVRRVDGDYLNVVGLPVATLLDLWPGLLDRP
jgi:septum formation protein